MIDVSIIIANFNTKDLTAACLKSLKQNIKGVNFEVILIDNASTDGSVEVLKKIHKEDFWKKRLNLILSKENTGFVGANNWGMKEAKGKYMFLLNSDTEVHKNSIENLVKFADNTKDAGVVGSKLLNTDGTLQMSCYNFPTIWNAIREYFFGVKGLFEKFAPKGDSPSTVDSLVGAAFLITTAAQKKVGLLDKRYFYYFEDIDYCRRTWRSGLKVYYLPDSIITHHHGASFKKLAGDDERWKKLIPSSKIYHGLVKHYVINAVLWLGQKWQKILGK